MYELKNGYPYDRSYWQEWFPADLITENFPGQFRNWFYAILTMSTVLENRPPFRVLHSYASLRDEHGQEMHKSKGNAIWSDDAAEKVGVDVMRWMFAKHNPVLNLNFGYGHAAEIKRNLLTLWNVYSFFVTYANIDGFNPQGKKIDSRQLTKLDRWIRSRTNSLIAQCDVMYDEYDTATIVKLTEDYFDDLSNWYVRRNRRRFWKSESDEDKETAYLVLYECLLKLIQLISAIMPFLTEEMYQNLVLQVDNNAASSIHLVDFPSVDSELIDEKLEKEVALTRSIVSLGRSARSKANIKIRQPLNEMIVSIPEEGYKISADDTAIILEELNIKDFKEVEEGKLDELSELKVTPRFDQLGPRFGKDAGAVAKAIKSLNQDEIDRLVKDGSLKKEVDGNILELSSGDVEVKSVDKRGWSIARDGELGVGVNTTVTEELKNEGLVRELIHKIQLMRKEANFDLTDRIKICFETGQELARAINVNIDYLKTETLAVDVCEGLEAGETKNVLNINGIETTVVLQRLKPS